MKDTADVIIVGGGIIGMSAAFQVARRSGLRVMVLEKGIGPGEGSTGASSAVCRFRYSYPEVVQLAKDGIAAYQDWPEFLGNEAPLAHFHRTGVLWLAAEADWATREAKRLQGFGLAADAIDDGELGRTFPAISPCSVAPDLVTGDAHDCRGGSLHLFERDGGYMDPVDALQDLIAAARERTVEVRFGQAVADVVVQNGRTSGIRLASGEVISSGTVILATGPWCLPILDRVGLGGRWPLEPTRIQIVHIERPAMLRGDLPVAVDLPGGIYFRPQNRGQQIIVGSVLEEDEREQVDNPDDFARYADDSFILPKLHALQHRLVLDDIRGSIRSYSGLYTINRADMHPVVGETPIGGLHVAVGCSGHGFKLAPAIGALLARGIVGGADSFDSSTDPSFFRWDREPIRLAAKNVLA